MTTESGYDWDPLIAVSALTDLGLKRTNNQDSLVVDLASNLQDWRDRGHLFVVADGMGAHAAGELASKLAVDQVSYLYRKHRDRSPNDALLSAIQEANGEIHRRGQANLSFHNMGTTCSSLLLLPQGAVAAHVGDSRVYLCRRGVLRQLTFDHSLVWEMQQATQSYSGQPELSFPKNVITRSIGPHPIVKVDLEGPFGIERGDTFLLCSDGLTGRVDDLEIASILTHLSSSEAAQLLMDLAILRGGHDNITLIVIRIQGDDLVTRASGTAPLTVEGPREPPTKVWLGFWISLGLCVLLASTLFTMGHVVGSLVALAAGVVPLIAILVQGLGLLREGPRTVGGAATLGRGPYTSSPSEARGDLLHRLEKIIEEASESAHERGWPEIGLSILPQPPKASASGKDLATACQQITQLAELCKKQARPISAPLE